MTEPDPWWWPGDDTEPPPAPARRRGRGSWQLAVAPVVAVVGLVLIVSGSVVLDRRQVGSVADFPRVSLAEHAKTLELGGGSWVTYLEAPGDGRPVPATARLTVRPVEPGAEVSVVHDYRRRLTYDAAGRHGAARWTFRVRHAGAFEVRVTDPGAPSGAGVALGRPVVGGLVVGVGLVLPGILLMTVAVGLAVLGWLMRRRHRREVAAALAQGWLPSE